MKMNVKQKWGIGIFAAILCLIGLILFGVRNAGQEPTYALDLSVETLPPAETSEPAEPSLPAKPGTSDTLEALLGKDYAQILTETVTTQMENRMRKDPDVQYYPIADKAPLSNYVSIGKETAFEIDNDGCLVILFPAGTVTSADNGMQRFRIYQVNTECE